MTILVTGASGLVGARLLPRLVQMGTDCRALMRGGKDAPAGVAVAPGDLLDTASLAKAVRGASAIIHLAAVFRTPDTDLIWKANLEGTRNLVAAVKSGAPRARFILASTSNVYDADVAGPGREDDIVDPQQAYPASKMAAEEVLRGSGLTWAILRLPFVYGDGDGHLAALPRHVAEGRWHPAHKMSTVHHRDVAQAVELALAGKLDGRIVNIADDAPSTVLELARLAGQAVGPSSEPLANPWHHHVDASLARRLGFRPVVRSNYQAAEEGIL